MKLKCNDGDIALVTREEAGCEFNIGKLVRVAGPVVKNTRGLATWLIEPLEHRLWWCLSPKGELECRMVTFKCRVVHPDAWLLPIAPEIWNELSEFSRKTLETV